MSRPIKGQGGHLGFSYQQKSNNTWSRPHKEHSYQLRSPSLQPFLRSRKCLSQSEARATILDIRIGTTSNNTWSGPHKDHLYQVRSQSQQPFLRKRRKCLSQSEATLDFQIRAKRNNTSLGTDKEHLYQVRSQSLQPFLRKIRKCLGQSETRVAR